MSNQDTDQNDQFATEEEKKNAADRPPKDGKDRPGFDLGGSTKEGRKGPHDIRPRDAGEGRLPRGP